MHGRSQAMLARACNGWLHVCMWLEFLASWVTAFRSLWEDIVRAFTSTVVLVLIIVFVYYFVLGVR